MHASALLFILSGGFLNADAGPSASRFDQAEAVRSWSFHNGPEFPGAQGRIEWNSAQGHDKPGCLALHYSFAGGGNYVQAAWALPKENPARTMTLWLKKPAAHRITFRATDSGGQSFQKGTDYTYPGWQQIEVNLAAWDNHWGGPDDGKVRFPIRQIGILVENSAEPREGALLIDDIALTDQTAGHRAVLHSTYTAAEFKVGSEWRAGSGADSRLTGDGAWHYDFRAGQTPTLSAEFSLVGQPQTLRLVLDGDGSGHAVHIAIGSHFQVFHRRIGTLEKKGEQTLEVPLGDMSTWKHHGGQDDGQVRYPLRMQRIWVERRAGGPDQGRLPLERLAVDMSFPADQAVALRPDIQSVKSGDRFSIELRNLRSTPAAGKLIYESRDLGRRRETKTVDLELPGGAKPVRQEFFHAHEGHNMVEASFQWIDPGCVSKPVSIGASRPLDAAGASTLQPESLMGCGLYLYRWRGDPRARENMTRLCELAQAAGIKWTREEIQWHATEPEPGRFDFAFYDQLVEVAHAHGLSVYGLLCYWSGWAKANTDEGIDQYCRWVRQVVRRYKGKIKYWEIWNEPNIFFWTGPKELYAKLLTRAYSAVKAEDPAAVVLGCSTSGIDTEFIKMVMAKGGPFDALTIHPYRGALDDLRYIQELKDVQNLVAGRDVWITEIGFPSQLVTGWSERRQASLAARVYLASLASGTVRSVSWYDFRNDGADPFEGEQNFGLVRSDFRLKPAYRAIATVCRTLAGMTVKDQIDIGPGAYAFRFSDGKRDVVAACAPDSGRVLSCETDADVSIADGVGRPVQPQRDGRRFALTLDTGFPVYFSGARGFAFQTIDPGPGLTVVPATVRPGDTVTIETVLADVGEWELPYGWPAPVDAERAPESRRAAYKLKVPAHAPPGGIDCQAILKGDSPLRLPFTIRVVPTIIRL